MLDTMRFCWVTSSGKALGVLAARVAPQTKVKRMPREERDSLSLTSNSGRSGFLMTTQRQLSRKRIPDSLYQSTEQTPSADMAQRHATYCVPVLNFVYAEITVEVQINALSYVH